MAGLPNWHIMLDMMTGFAMVGYGIAMAIKVSNLEGNSLSGAVGHLLALIMFWMLAGIFFYGAISGFIRLLK